MKVESQVFERGKFVKFNSSKQHHLLPALQLYNVHRKDNDRGHRIQYKMSIVL